MSRHRDVPLPSWVDGVAIVVVVLACWANASRAPFVFDDLSNITQNPYMQVQGFDLPGFVTAALESRSPRPLSNLSFAVNHAVCGLDATCFRAVNVAIHAANGVLVNALALLLFLRLRPEEPRAARNLSLVAALLFVAHPLQVQSVTYVVQRMTALATLFYLGALLLWLRGRLQPAGPARSRAWVWAAVCGVLSFASKQIAVTLPLAIALVEWVFFQQARTDWLRKRWRPAAALLGLLLVAGVAYLALLGFPGYEDRDFTVGQRVLTQLRVVPFYLSLVVLPLPSRLCLLHWFEPSRGLFDPVTTALGGVFLVAFFGFGAWVVRRERLLGFAILWVGLQLALESSVLPLEMAYEHRMYLPLFGISLAVADGLWRAVGRREAWFVAVAMALCASLVVGTHLRNRDWRDAVVFWRDVATKSPEDDRGHMNLAIELRARGRLDEAEAHLAELLAGRPDFADAWHVHGIVAEWRGDPETALARYREARRLDPDDPFFPMKEGLVLATLGRPDEGIAVLRQLTREHPDWVRGWFALGVTLERFGDRGEARRAYEETVALDPDHRGAHLRLATLAASAGDFEAAVRHLREAQRLAPNDPELRELVSRAEAAARGTAAQELPPEIDAAGGDSQ